MTTREEKIAKIKKVISPTQIGVPGHSVCSHELRMIGDVLEYIHSIIWDDEKTVIYRLYLRWSDRRKPIQDQSDECIDYVYSLIESDK